MSTALAGALVMAAPFAAADGSIQPWHSKVAPWHSQHVTPTVSQTGVAYHAGPVNVLPKGAAALASYKSTPAAWPAASISTVSLTRAASTTTGASPSSPSAAAGPVTAVTGPVRAGTSPVALAPLASAALSGGKARTFAGTAGAQAAGIPSRVRVQVASHAQASGAGVDGMLIGLTQADTTTTGGKVSLQVDYASLAKAFGGGWATRLKLVSYPACILTTPQVASCHTANPLVSTNQLASQTLTATVSLPATTPAIPAASGATVVPSSYVVPASATAVSGTAVGVVGATGGSQGSYAASNITTGAGSWSESGSGAFTYSYPINVPTSLGGSAPSVALSYDSQAVDGETSARNSQASWIGDGWSYSPGSISVAYRPCSGDGIATSGDECWGGFNGTMSFDGHNGVLVPVGGADSSKGILQVFKLQNDDGTLVQERTGAANGLYQGTWFKVTTTSGASAYFGLNHAPSATGDVGVNTDAATNSAWGVPVYCPKTTDPCNGSTSSRALMGYKYNLDFTVGVDTGLQRLDYTAETNYYNMGSGQAGGKGDVTDSGYTRGGYLTKISYGWQLADEVAGRFSAAEVDFTTAARCNATGCGYSTLTADTASSWPDVPYDLNCKQTDSNDTSTSGSPVAGTCYIGSPTFWSEARLDSITTKVRINKILTPVDKYQLTQLYTATGGTDPLTNTTIDGKDAASLQAVLWLSSIQHTGEDVKGGATAFSAMNPVTFVGQEFDNRANDDMTGSVSQEPPLYRPRLVRVINETGGAVEVTYDTPSCAGANTPSKPDSNTSKCFPVYWTDPGSGAGATPELEYFNKYTVHTVTAQDLVAGSPPQTSTYSYSGPAWHRDDNALTDDQYRTWDQFRGFHQVTVTTGDPNSGAVLTQATTTYLQGMDGDYLSDGTTQRSVTATATVAGSTVASFPDSDYLFGTALQSDTYTQAGGTVLASHITRAPVLNTNTNEPSVAQTGWTSKSGASPQTLPPLKAYRIKSATSDSYSLLKGSDSANLNTWRHTSTTTGYDDQGRVSTVDNLGDVSVPAQEKCTTTSYATAPSTNSMMLAYPDETITVAGPCSTVPSSTNPALSDSRVYYDGDGTITNPGTLGVLSSNGTTNGLATATSKLTGYSGTTAQFTVESAMVYDTYGRVTQTLDANGQKTTTTFTSYQTGEMPYQVQSANPQNWKTTSVLDVERGLATADTDTNTRLTSSSYDALGRRTAVWLPARPKASNSSSPSLKFSYSIDPGATAPTAVGVITNPGAASSVTTQTLREDGTYSSSITIYDGLMQKRETQANAGSDTSLTTTDRLVSDTQYDTHGWTVSSYPAYYDNTAGPSGTLSLVEPSTAQAETRTVYDGTGRATATQLFHQGIQQWQSTTSYPGADETDTTSPAGGPATVTRTNALGQTTSSIVQDTDATVTLTPGQVIPSGTSLTSASVRLAMGADGNLVLTSLTSGKTLWSSGTSGNPGAWATFQTDGNFVVYDAGRTKSLWAAATSATGGTLKLQNDANLVVYTSAGTAAWSSSTSGQATEADATTSYTYTPAGQVATVKNTAGNTWSYSYNLLGQETAQSDPNTGTSSYGPYDNQGNLLQSTDSRGQILSYHYDWDNRLVGAYTGAYTATPVAANELTSTLYDSLVAGYPTSTTRYIGGNVGTGNTYTQGVTGYNTSYQPTMTYVEVPSTDKYVQPGLSSGDTANTGETRFEQTPTYSPVTGELAGLQYNNDGGLPSETVAYAYNLQGELDGMGSSTGAAYLDDLQHDGFGQVVQADYGTYGQELETTAQYDTTTGRLDNTTATLQGPNNVADFTSYRYNQVGELTAVDDWQVSAATHDTQCFSYNSMQRLTQAWTDTAGITNAPSDPKTPNDTTVGNLGGCNTTTPTTTATAPVTTTTVGGPAAYWQSYTYDLLGDRTGLVNHDTTGSAANNTTQSVTCAGADATVTAGTPDQCSTTITSNPTLGTTTQSSTHTDTGYTPNANAGNTMSRNTSTTGRVTTAFTLSSGSSLCIDDSTSSTTAGNKVQVYTCNGSNAQSLTIGTDHTVRVLGMCLDTTGQATTAGTKVVINTCDTTKNTQLWKTTQTGTLVNAGNTALCLTDPAAGLKSTQLTIDSCAGTGQTWTTPASATATGAIPAGMAQNFNYDAQGRTSTVTTNTGATTQTSSYLYDAAGNLIEQSDPGTKTLYLFGGTEQITQYTSGGNTAENALRLYPGPDGTTITRDQSNTVNYQRSLGQGTGTELINAANDAVTRRYYDPYGNPRGTTPTTWASTYDNLGFLNKPTDTTTGLDQLGARNYDPAQGRFLTPDPLFEAGDPNQMGGYTYAADNPASSSDPSGLRVYQLDDGGSGGSTTNTSTTTSTGNTSVTQNAGESALQSIGDWLSSTLDTRDDHTMSNSWHSWATKHLHANYDDGTASVMDLGWGIALTVATDGSGGESTLESASGLTSKFKNFFTEKAAEDSGAAIAARAAGAPVADAAAVDASAAADASSEADMLTAKRAHADAELQAQKAVKTKTTPSDATTGSSGSGAADDTVGAKCSFSPDTPVLMEDGGSKPIGKIKIGDKVEAADPATGKDAGGRAVQHVWINHDTDLLDVTVNDGIGHTKTVHTTANHPFWDGTTRTWTRADRLKPGDKLASTKGHHPTVLTTKATPGAASRWNLTVTQLHTYYVMAGATPILVHNTNGVCTLNDSSSQTSQVAMNARMTNRVKPGQNVAVYRIGSGEDSRFLAAANDPGGLHSEEILDNYLDANGISPDDVTEIYSERVPCSTDPHNCSARMGRYGNADISWSLNPDGINNGAKNAGAIARAMGSYRGAPPGLPGFEWIG